VQAGQEPGFPRFHGRNRSQSLTYKQYCNGARLDHGFLVLSKMGRVAVRWSRPLVRRRGYATTSLDWARSPCGAEHFAGWAGTSWSGGSTRRGAASIHRAVARVECQQGAVMAR